MGVREKREQERTKHRQRILDAALAIITEEGFAALSMRKLAERIKYSPASIYLHFKNREQLAQELSEAGLQELLPKLMAAAALPDAAAALDAMGSAYVRYGMENPAMYRLIFMGDSAYMAAAFGKQSEGSAGLRAYRILVDLAARLQQQGSIGHGEAAAFADLIWMTLHGIVSLHLVCVGVQLAPPERLAALATEMLGRGLPNHLR